MILPFLLPLEELMKEGFTVSEAIDDSKGRASAAKAVAL
jgi:hypothetical protein